MIKLHEKGNSKISNFKISTALQSNNIHIVLNIISLVHIVAKM